MAQKTIYIKDKDVAVWEEVKQILREENSSMSDLIIPYLAERLKKLNELEFLDI